MAERAATPVERSREMERLLLARSGLFGATVAANGTPKDTRMAGILADFAEARERYYREQDEALRRGVPWARDIREVYEATERAIQDLIDRKIAAFCSRAREVTDVRERARYAYAALAPLASERRLPSPADQDVLDALWELGEINPDSWDSDYEQYAPRAIPRPEPQGSVIYEKRERYEAWKRERRTTDQKGA